MQTSDTRVEAATFQNPAADPFYNTTSRGKVEEGQPSRSDRLAAPTPGFRPPQPGAFPPRPSPQAPGIIRSRRPRRSARIGRPFDFTGLFVVFAATHFLL